jgi:hypothetical protein
MFFANGKDLFGSGFECAIEDRIGIVDGEDHSKGVAAERFWFVSIAHPKLGAVDRQSGNDTIVGGIEFVNDYCSECILIKLQREGAVANGEPWRDGSFRSH